MSVSKFVVGIGAKKSVESLVLCFPLFLVFWQFWKPLSLTYSASLIAFGKHDNNWNVLFPHHPPKVIFCRWQGTLCCYKLSLGIKTLKRNFTNDNTPEKSQVQLIFQTDVKNFWISNFSDAPRRKSICQCNKNRNIFLNCDSHSWLFMLLLLAKLCPHSVLLKLLETVDSQACNWRWCSQTPPHHFQLTATSLVNDRLNKRIFIQWLCSGKSFSSMWPTVALQEMKFLCLLTIGPILTRQNIRVSVFHPVCWHFGDIPILFWTHLSQQLEREQNATCEFFCLRNSHCHGSLPKPARSVCSW